ncbi:MAG: glycosyltransferase family 4 protein [Chlorobiales bacterium]|nr:glycosyltransferase family 4 protein [Chlorobiales bacterium]
MKLREIVIFSEDFPPKDGGIAQWAMGVARSLRKMGYGVHVLTRYLSHAAEGIQNQEPYPVVQVHGNRWRQFRSLYAYRGLKSFYESGKKPEVVIATTWNIARGLISLVRKHRTKLVVVIHGLEVTRKMSWLKRRWMVQTLNAADAIISVSQFTRKQVLDHYPVNPDKVLVLPNGVDSEYFCPGANTTALRKKFKLEGKKVILTLARLIERKGHDKVIEAMPKVIQKVPDAHYLISGTPKGEYYERLLKLIEALGLRDNVTFVGYIPAEEMNQYYNLCDVYIMPSRELEGVGDTEGFGITYLEANACEKPVIGGRSGGVVDAIVDGKTGYLVDPLSVDEIGEKLSLLLSDSELATRLGKSGRARIEEGYTWETVTKSLIATIK